MKRVLVLLFTVIISILIAGVYGVINDQITYSISEEYFTKFKFEQFGIFPDEVGGPKIAVGMIGFFATWWMGLIIGTSIGLLGFIFKNYKVMMKTIAKTILLIFTGTIFFALIGFLYGNYCLVGTSVYWVPSNIVGKDSFIIVGSIHNFSYFGGLLSWVIGIVYMIKKKKELSKK